MTITSIDAIATESRVDVNAREVNHIPDPQIVPSSSLAALNKSRPATTKSDEPTRRVRNQTFHKITRRPGSKQFIPLARWEGTVSERYETYFVAEVIDLDSSESATAEFNLSDLTPGDVQLCEPGALFYWTIGYDVKEGGQRSRTSVINFRRLGRASK